MPQNQINDPAGASADSRDLHSMVWEIVRNVYRTIHTSGLYTFTFLWVDVLYGDLDAVLFELERLPTNVSMEFLEAAEWVTKARDELRLARFLFDVEEIDPLYRLVMRNRAILRCESMLCKVVRGSLHPSSSK